MQCSNLRWDLPADQVHYYWNQTGDKSSSGPTQLVEFSRGVCGGGNLPRSLFLFDAVNLPKVRAFACPFLFSCCWSSDCGCFHSSGVIDDLYENR